MDRILFLAAVIMVSLFGFVKLLREKRNIEENHSFALEFLDNIKKYLASRGRDLQTYSWLINKSNRMQGQLGSEGFYAFFRPPFRNFQYRNYPIILNMLPELRQSFENDIYGRGDLPHKYGSSIQEAIIRHLGTIEQVRDQHHICLRNPFIWLREGVRLVISIPVSLLSWSGMMSDNAINIVVNSYFFRMISAFVTIIGFVSAVIGIVLGWEEFSKWLVKLLNKFS